jgi:hypothetical protein
LAVEKVDIELRGARPWFHILAVLAARAPWWILLPMALLALQFVSRHPEWFTMKATPTSTAVSAGLGVVLGGMIMAVVGVQRWTFPLASFKLGHGRARFDHQHMVRGAFVIGIAASTVFALLRWLIVG